MINNANSRFECGHIEDAKEEKHFDGASQFPRLAVRDALLGIARAWIRQGHSGTKYCQVPSTKYKVQSTKYQVPSTKYYLALWDPLLGFARISEGHSGTNTPSSFLSKDLVLVRKVGIWQRWWWLMISVHIFFIVNAAGDLLDPHLLLVPDPLLHKV